MSTAPNAVFLDASVFDGQNYKYDSRKFKDFLKQRFDKQLEFLLPHPTELEIRRHAKQRADVAISSIRQAVVQGPFLRKLDNFAGYELMKDTFENIVRELAQRELDAFLRSVHVKRLHYDGIDIKSLMEDYDRCVPPFAEGEKRKEFPDAFAIAILAHYAMTENKRIAVVSEDKDFARACTARSRLLYFANLEEITASLLRDSDLERVGRYTQAIEAAGEKFERQFVEPIKHLLFVHDAVPLLKSDVQKGSLFGFNVVAVGNNECTIAFDAEVGAQHVFGWPEPRDPTKQVRDELWMTSLVKGTAKVTFRAAKKGGKDPGWELTYDSVSAIEFDDFGIVHVRAMPPNFVPQLGLLSGLGGIGGGEFGTPTVEQVGGLLQLLRNPYLFPQPKATGEDEQT